MREDVGSVRIGTTEIVNFGDRVLIRDLENGGELSVDRDELPRLARRLREAGSDD